MSIIIKLEGMEELIQQLRTLPLSIQQAVFQKMEKLAQDISDRIKQKLSGEVLNIKSGALRNSIYARVYQSQGKMTLSFGSRGDVPYAATQEYGLNVQHPGVIDKGHVLAYLTGGTKRFARSIAAHVIPMPERSFLRSTEEEYVPGFTQAIQDGMDEAIHNAGD